MGELRRLFRLEIGIPVCVSVMCVIVTLFPVRCPCSLMLIADP